MRDVIAPLCALLLCALFTAPAVADDIRYFACRADNEDSQSLVAVDATTKKVCDHEFAERWMTPTVFDPTTIAWGDGAATRKSITMGRKGSRYEHDTYFIVVHIGHCNKVKAPAVPLCNG